MAIVTADIMRSLEQNFVAQGGSYMDLMENAGRAVAAEIMNQQGEIPTALILCGKGNNGGDGFVIARILKENGFAVDVALADGMPQTEAAALNFKCLPPEVRIFNYYEDRENVFLGIQQGYGFIVDALYGIGFHGELNEDLAILLNACNSSPSIRIAVDIPSGVNCDSGEVSQSSFRADKTVTFTLPKLAHVIYPSLEYCGELRIADIGIPQRLAASCPYVLQTTQDYVSMHPLPKRKSVSHKGTYGRLMCVCGSYGMAGAAVLAGSAALHSGVGLVTLTVPKSIYEICASRLIEATFMPMEQNDDGTLNIEAFNKIIYTVSDECNAVLVGCGLGYNDETWEMVGLLVENLDKPLILDADGINAICMHTDILKQAKAPVILTPHIGEMARLIGAEVEQVKADMLGTAQRIAQEYHVYVVLKDVHTIIASPEGEMLVNFTGCAGMAKGGSGDVLAGLMGGFLAQGMLPMAAAANAVYYHGLAGEYASKDASQRTTTAMQIVEALEKHKII